MNRPKFRWEGYHPKHAIYLSQDSLATWLRNPIEGYLDEVPGIGVNDIKLFEKQGIKTTWQLIGKFLSYKTDEITSTEHCDLFWDFLKQEVGIKYRASEIVRCIAEKVDMMMPGLYDPSRY